MRRTYSRLASVEERKNKRSAVLFILLTIAAVLILFFVGLPILGNFAAFVSEIGKSTKPITSSDNTPPAPPRFDNYPDFTNEKEFTLGGSTEPGATIKLTFNGKEQDGLSDNDGKFHFNLSLTNGENSFSAAAVDAAGNASQTSADGKVVYDNKPPDLTIDYPSDGTQYLGSKQRQITIQGTTEVNCQITINDRIVSVDDSGKFQYTTSLNDGENKFTIKSTDQAGNTTESSLTLNFTS
jgi:hypothetical protein